MTPVCPKCGSIKVRVVVRSGHCLEDDCGHTGTASSFRPESLNPDGIRAPVANWRDPVAMSMDGYEE